MRTRKIYNNKINNRGGGFFDFFRGNKNKNIPMSASVSVPVSAPVSAPPPVKNATLKKVVVGSDKVAEPILKGVDIIEKIDEKRETLAKISSNLKPLESIVHNVTEIIKLHPIGHLIIGTLLFVKKLKDLYSNHQQIVAFLTQVETILENSYRLNELVDKINEMMVIYTFNNQEYKNKYNELFNLEKEILNTKNDDTLKQLDSKKNELFNGLLETANNTKQKYRSELSSVEFDNLDKFIEPNKLIKEQLTIKIADINKYLLSIATNDMLNALTSDMNINKSGLIRLVNDEIELRKKRKNTWLKDRIKDWNRVNSRDSIMRKLNDDLILMNSLFILVKFQMDFTVEYYKNKNISPEEWNTLWKLITSFKEYTSYMIPSEVFMTIKYVNDIIESDAVNSKKAIMDLGDVIMSEVNDETNEMIQLENLNESNQLINEEPTMEETSVGGKIKRRKLKTRKLVTRKLVTNKLKTRKIKNRKNKNRYIKNKKFIK
jgi:hypothetical protein